MPCEQQLQPNEVKRSKRILRHVKNVFNFSSGPLHEDKSQTKSNKEASSILDEYETMDLLPCRHFDLW